MNYPPSREETHRRRYLAACLAKQKEKRKYGMLTGADKLKISEEVNVKITLRDDGQSEQVV